VAHALRALPARSAVARSTGRLPALATSPTGAAPRTRRL
jgi:hypothetical protein